MIKKTVSKESFTAFFKLHEFKKRRSGNLQTVCILLVLASILVPIYFMTKYSFSDTTSINMGGDVIPLWPNHWTVASYAYILSDKTFLAVIFNSLSIAMLTILFSMALGVPAAYALSRTSWPIKIACLTALLSVRLFPDVSSVIPVAEIFVRVGLQNTRIGAGLAHSLLALPYVVYIAIGVFESIPRDLEEQSWVLGASRSYSLIRVVLPLAVPGLVAAGIYTFLLSWDEFIFAYFLLGFGNVNTLTVYLKKQFAFSPPQNILATISVILSLPVIIFTLLVQKYMKTGITAGSVK
jgi:multiple sugar transport system permease protein